MAFLGFLIDREYDKPLIIFTEKKELNSIQIIGFKQIMVEEYDTIFLDSDGEEKSFILLDPKTFVYSKISLGERKIIDYKYRTFWFGAKKYKILRDLFYVRNVNKGDYSLRFIEILQQV
jgi:hypothetical protein